MQVPSKHHSFSIVSLHQILITFFVTFESRKKLKSLQYNEIPHFNPFSLTSDLDRISPYIISTISSRQVMRIKKRIKKGIIG